MAGFETTLERFEATVHRRDLEEAGRQLLAILANLQTNSGRIDSSLHPHAGELPTVEAYDDHVIHRLASAITALFADPAFQPSSDGFNELMQRQRWIASIFAASSFQSADHILHIYNRHPDPGPGDYIIGKKDLLKFAILYGPDSRVPLKIDTLWDHAPQVAIALGWALITPRYLGSSIGHQKRNLLLPWMSEKLTQLEGLAAIPSQTIHDVYMHCSYATISDRHDIKRSINTLVRRWLESRGINDLPLTPQAIRTESNQPVALVLLEWFGSHHSIYRTHSKAIEAMRQDFKVIGVGYDSSVDPESRKVFDTFIEVPKVDLELQIRQVHHLCQQHQPAVIYMTSIGMFPLNIVLSNLRLAPVQVTTWGHPATSHSSFIDHYIAERDLIPDPSLFSESILWLEPDEMPFRITRTMEATMERKSGWPSRHAHNPRTNIAICASAMKLNPTFVATLIQVAQAVETPIHYHFLVGGAIGVLHRQIVRTMAQGLPGLCTVYPQLDYDTYMQVIAQCDLCLNPYPFGNCNGIVDALLNGVVGVCMQGPHLFEAIDQALYRRLGLPDWLIATDEASYIEAAVRLIHHPEERRELSARFGTIESLQPLHQGRDRALSEHLLAAIKARSSPATTP